MSGARQTVLAAAAFAVFLAAFFIQGLLSLRLKSPTFDEVTYFGIGQYLLYTGRFDVPGSGTHPPLGFYLSSIPLLGRRLEGDLWAYPDRLRNRFGRRFVLAHDQGRGQKLFSRDRPSDRLLNRCRTSVLSLAFLLGALIFLWSRHHFGLGGAFVSLALFAFDPNLLAHARLITPDFLLTTTFFAAAFFTAARGNGFQGHRWAWAGVFLGLALLSKHAALVLIPSLFVVYLVNGWSRERVSRVGLVLFGVAAVAALVVTVGFQFKPLLYIESLRLQLEHASSGHRAYLWGEISQQGWWYYHIVAMALKTPLPLFILVLWSVVAGALRALPRRDALALALPPLALILGFALFQGPNIGLRYVLPVYPFLIVLAGGAAAVRPSRLAQAALLLLLTWQVAGTLKVYPDYLAYFNVAIGGPKNGYKYLVDSNLDWGQDLKQLKSYMDRHQLERIRLSYFGAAKPEMYSIQYDPMPGYYLGKDLPSPTDLSGALAISATNLVGVYLRDPATFARLRARRPDAVIGHSIFIYNPR